MLFLANPIFFWGLFSQLNVPSGKKKKKKRPKSRRGNCLVLPQASYGPDHYNENKDI